MRQKQQTTEHEDSHDHIISHHAPAGYFNHVANLLKYFDKLQKIIVISDFKPFNWLY